MSAAILVVHDEPAVLGMLTRVFENDGIPVVEASNARRAVHLYGAHINDIGVVVCGLRLSGLRGETLVKALRTIDPSVRMFIFSAIEPSFELPDGVQVFAKPGELNVLRQAVRDLLADKAPAQRDHQGCRIFRTFRDLATGRWPSARW